MNVQELKELILNEKKKSDTLILAHTYQSPDIIDIADIAGDSFALSKSAKEYPCKRVLMCGVRFMAETVKILSPEKTVILPASGATCPMAEQIDPMRVMQFKQENPDAVVVVYINTTAALKAVADVCVTSSSAVKIVSGIDAPKILFIPDKNLGAWVAGQLPEKNIILWEGCCPIHNELTEEDVINAKRERPGALLLLHPECPPETLAHADMVGSTAAIIDFALSSEKAVIIGTVRGVADYLTLHNSGKKIYYLTPEKLRCEDMEKVTLENIYSALIGEGGEQLEMDEELRIKAKKCIDKMLELGN